MLMICFAGVFHIQWQLTFSSVILRNHCLICGFPNLAKIQHVLLLFFFVCLVQITCYPPIISYPMVPMIGLNLSINDFNNSKFFQFLWYESIISYQLVLIIRLVDTPQIYQFAPYTFTMSTRNFFFTFGINVILKFEIFFKIQYLCHQLCFQRP